MEYSEAEKDFWEDEIRTHPSSMITVLPSLAKKIGLHEAIVLTELRRMISDSYCEKFNKYFVYISEAQRKYRLPFLNKSELQKIFNNLEKMRLIGSCYKETESVKIKCYAIYAKKYNDTIAKLPSMLPKIHPNTKVYRNTDTSEYKLFYRTEEWLKLRKQVIDKYGKVCMKCGVDDKEGIVMHVDHIVPRSLDKTKELDFENLQVLCETCNIRKSNSESIDYRKFSMIR